MKLAVICSAGGGSFAQAFDLIHTAGLISADDVLLITDRPCGAEHLAATRGLRTQRIEAPDKDEFSQRASDAIASFGGEHVLLSFSRMVGEAIYQRLPTLNVHPSLLPSFAGIGALRAAKHSGARVFGATLHIVTAEMDGGPVLAQTWSPLDATMPLEEMERLSFVHKTYLIALAFEHLRRGCGLEDFQSTHSRITVSASPAFATAAMENAFSDLVSARGMSQFVP